MSILWNIEKYGEVSSTQDILKEKAREGAKEGLVIVAESQTKGRGRHGNQWVSEKGNLYASFLLRPDCAPSEIGHYSFIIGLSLYKTIEEAVSNKVQMNLKWPNDILMDGQKCAGILIESDLFVDGKGKALFVGVGVNIKSAPKGKARLENISGKDEEPMVFLMLLMDKIKNYIELYDKEGFFTIRKGWLKHAAYIGNIIQARFANRILEGRFVDIDEQGALILDQGDEEMITITAGEIFGL